jgi:phospholipase C
MLRFIETRFGVEAPNLSAWRRDAVGDLTSTLDFTKPDPTVPSLPDTLAPAVAATATCAPSYPSQATFQDVPTYPAPKRQEMPHQESGTRPSRG